MIFLSALKPLLAWREQAVVPKTTVPWAAEHGHRGGPVQHGHPQQRVAAAQ